MDAWIEAVQMNHKTLTGRNIGDYDFLLDWWVFYEAYGHMTPGDAAKLIAGK